MGAPTAIRSLGLADALSIIAYVILMAYVAIRTRRSSGFLDYALASRALPTVLIFASLSSTYIGPGFSLGAVARGLTTGWYNYFLFLPFCLQTILIGWYVAPRLAALDNCASIGDVFLAKYGVLGQRLAGICSVGICVLFSAFLAKAAGVSLSAFTGWEFHTCVIAVTVLTAAYTYSGGLRADVLTDAVQFALFCTIIGVMTLLLLGRSDLSISNALHAMRENTVLSWKTTAPIASFGVAVSFLLGETLIPPYANRALASESPMSSRRSFLMAGGFGVIWLALVTGIGLLAGGLGIPSDAGDQALVRLGAKTLPGGLWGLLLVAILSIIMSSQDSVLNAGGVSLARDFRRRRDGSRSAEVADLRLARVGTILMAITGAAIAGWLPGIIEALLLIYSLWAPTVLVPLVLGVVLRRPPPSSGWLSMLCGGLASIGWQFVLKNPGGIPAILPGVAASLVGFGCGFLVRARRVVR